MQDMSNVQQNKNILPCFKNRSSKPARPFSAAIYNGDLFELSTSVIFPPCSSNTLATSTKLYMAARKSGERLFLLSTSFTRWRMKSWSNNFLRIPILESDAILLKIYFFSHSELGIVLLKVKSTPTGYSNESKL